jgi:hypothetical protein
MYNPNFDFKYLKTKVGIDQVLAAYGLATKLRRRNHLLYGPCPLHGGDNPTAFHVHLKRGLWRCFTACGGGDIVDLIRSIEKCSFAEAAHHLNRLMGYVKPSSDSLFYTSPQPNNCTFSPFVYHIPLKPSVPFLQDIKKSRFPLHCAMKQALPTKALFFEALWQSASMIFPVNLSATVAATLIISQLFVGENGAFLKISPKRTYSIMLTVPYVPENKVSSLLSALGL